MSKIEWTDETWNPIVGCSLASPGCTNCYAMRFAGTRLGHVAKYDGLTEASKAGPVWTGKLAPDEKALLAPLSWKKPRMVFVNSMGDLFHEDCTDEWIDRVFAVMALCPQHTFQVLTKRSGRMREYLTTHRWHEWAKIGRATDAERWVDLKPIIGGDCTPLPNVWLGVSVEDQKRADERIPDLLATPAAVRWISAEPLLGPVDLRRISTMQFRGAEAVDALAGNALDFLGERVGNMRSLDWVVVGGGCAVLLQAVGGMGRQFRP